jgi:hypothetical protein
MDWRIDLTRIRAAFRNCFANKPPPQKKKKLEMVQQMHETSKVIHL